MDPIAVRQFYALVHWWLGRLLTLCAKKAGTAKAAPAQVLGTYNSAKIASHLIDYKVITARELPGSSETAIDLALAEDR